MNKKQTSNKQGVALLLVTVAYIATSIIFQWNISLGIDIDALYVLKDKFMILALGAYAYKHIYSTKVLLPLSCALMYTGIQTLIYCIINLEVAALNGVILTIANPVVNIPLCLLGGVLLVVVISNNKLN